MASKKQPTHYWYKVCACYKSGYGQPEYFRVPAGANNADVEEAAAGLVYSDPEGIRPDKIERVAKPPKQWLKAKIISHFEQAKDLQKAAKHLVTEYKRLYPAKPKSVVATYKDVGMPAGMGEAVNDMMASLGVKGIQMGSLHMTVTKPKK